MKHYKYLILGGGLTGDAAARGIRELDADGSIGMISAESDPPYVRPALTKALWKGSPLEKIWRNTRSLNVEMHLGRTVTQLDAQKKSLHDEQGEDYTFDKLLLATGGSPVRLPLRGENILYYRNLQDYYRLRAMSEKGERFLVIGGGFIGSEIAAALTMNNRKVTMILRGQAIGASVYPKDLALFLNDYFRQKEVEVVTGDSVASVDETGGRLQVRTGSGRVFEVDGVVAGIGIRPNIELARSAGLVVSNGIEVDAHLETSAADIYAAGDAAFFQHAALGKRVRVEHEDNALQMGRLAGRNMAGANESYDHTPMFYSDLFDLGYEAIGELSSKLEMVSDWQEPFRKGVVYYLEGGRVRGVLLWNVWNRVDAARALLIEPGPLKEKDLKSRITD